MKSQATSTQCPTCKHPIEITITVGNALMIPKPGDEIVCRTCGAIGRFNAQLQVEILKESDCNPELWDTLKAVQNAIRKTPIRGC